MLNSRLPSFLSLWSFHHYHVHLYARFDSIFERSKEIDDEMNRVEISECSWCYVVKLEQELKPEQLTRGDNMSS